MIINDKVLADISAANPQTVSDLLMVDGVSNAFITKYGDFFIGVVEKKRSRGSPSTTKDTSYELYKSGKSVAEIVASRSLKKMTIESHITDKMSENPKDIDRTRVGITDNTLKRIKEAVKTVGKSRLKPIKEVVDFDGGKKLSYFQIKIGLVLLG
jgi:ATP-dependent DNA helicase RecQ